MNNNMYNQNGMINNVPQNMEQMPMQPMTPPVQPMVPPTPTTNAPTNGATVNNLKSTLSSIDKDLAKKYIGMGAGIFIILSVFLPYTTNSSLWDSDAIVFKMSYLVLGLIPIITFFFQKAKRLSYLSAGFVFSYVIMWYDTAEGFSGLSFGYYLALIASVALIVLCIMEDMGEIKGLFTTKTKVSAGGNVSAPPMQAPVIPNSNPTLPVQPQPVQTPVAQAPMSTQPTVLPNVLNGPIQPVVQTVEVCNICGQPKRNPMDTVCPNCGQRY